MITLWPLRFTKRLLAQAPNEALLYHLMLAQAALEINILRKQGTIAGTVDNPNRFDGLAGVAMTQLNVRLLAGRLVEARNLLEKPRFKAVRKELDKVMNPKGILARKNFIALSGDRSGLIQQIRNQAAFHLDDTAAAAALDAIDEDHEYVDYLCPERGNTAMLSGFVLSGVQFARLACTHDLGLGTELALNAVNDAARLFEDHVEHFVIAFTDSYLSGALERARDEEIELEDFPKLETFRVPYFFDTEGLLESLIEAR